MICTNCKNNIPDNVKFCPKCGTRLMQAPGSRQPQGQGGQPPRPQGGQRPQQGGGQRPQRPAQQSRPQPRPQAAGNRQTAGQAPVPPRPERVPSSDSRKSEKKKGGGSPKLVALLAVLAVILLALVGGLVYLLVSDDSSDDKGNTHSSAKKTDDDDDEEDTEEVVASSEDAGESVIAASADSTEADADDKEDSTETEKAQEEEAAADPRTVQVEIKDTEAPMTAINLAVQQVDASDFPKTRLYLNVADPATNSVPADLEQAFFYVEKKDANGTYIKQEVQAISQLNESQSLSVDIVADLSGSMNGGPLAEAQSIMSGFINTVQFGYGDQVELTTFSNGVTIVRDFTGDASVLLGDIASFRTEDMTALFDALYTSVQRTATQVGARCVVAFTDGKDNYSSCTPDVVIEAAVRYHIPIFIIGIGDVDTDDCRRICDATGGVYYGINEVASMEDIYNQIYLTEKQMYMVEFNDISGDDISAASDIRVGYRSSFYGGESTYNYEPNVLLSANTSNLYADGPEAVVEKYIRGFATAMTTSDFGNIEPYLFPGSNIYNTQRSYIQQNIAEILDSCEIVSTVYNGDSSCVVTTRETYYVQKPGVHLELMTQQCQYAMIKANDTWYLSDFASNVIVLSRINA